MKKKLVDAMYGSVVLLLLPFLLVLQADTRPGSPSSLFQIAPQALPTTIANIATLGSQKPPLGKDVYVCQMWFSIAPNGGTVNITVATGQGTPVNIWDHIPITATSATQGTLYTLISGSMPDGCVWFPGGATVLASGSGVNIVALSGRY